MSSSNRVWAIVPAAGSGSRMNGARPKQYLHIHDKTIIEHTLECLLASERLDEIVVCLPEADQTFSGLAVSAHPLVNRVVGGAQRALSVVNGLEFLHHRANPDDWVLVHDAARPCLGTLAVDSLVKQLGDNMVGGILAIPVSDTLKQADSEQGIARTIDRSGIWQAQTPQAFRYGLLYESLKAALAAGVQITDEASAIEWAGHTPKLVVGDPRNIKVTTPDDLAFAEFLLSRKTSTIKT